MKKYLIILSAAVFAAAGCMQFEHDVPVDEEYVDAPTITINEVGDEGFTATITPVSGTGYYSYAVKSGAAAEVDPTAVFKGLSGSVVKGTVSYAKSPSYTLTVNGLDMNNEYTIYAVSSSELGCIGSVVTSSIHTSDSVIPSIDDYDISGTKVALAFSEKVSYNENKPLEINYYGINTPGIKVNEPLGEVKDFKVSISGTVVTIDCGSMPDGANFAVSIPEGAFVDAAGNPCEEVISGFLENKGSIAGVGLYGRKPTKAFDLSIYGGKPVEMVTSMSEAIWMSIPEGVQIAKFDNSQEGLIEYEFSDGIHSSTDSYIVYGGAPDYGYGWNGNYNCALTYPNAGEYFTGRPDPARGSMVTITIPSFLTDIYGNQNAEFVIGPFLFSYGYTLNDIIGTYTVEAESYWDGPITDSFVIEASDNAAKGNVMFTSIYGDKCDTNVYADFDCDLGVLTIPDYQPIWTMSDGTYYFAINGADFVTLSMPKSGILTGPSEWFGYYFEGKSDADSGWGDIFISFDATKSATALSSAKAPHKVRSFGKTIK